MLKFFNTKYDDQRHFMLGALMLIGLAMLFWFSTNPKVTAGHSQQASLILYAEFDQIQGIEIGSPLTLAGIKIGAVSAIKLDSETHRIQLRLAVDEPLELPFDSSVKIVSDGLFGQKTLALQPGAEFDLLQNDDTIEYSQDAIILEEILQLIVERAEAVRGLNP